MLTPPASVMTAVSAQTSAGADWLTSVILCRVLYRIMQLLHLRIAATGLKAAATSSSVVRHVFMTLEVPLEAGWLLGSVGRTTQQAGADAGMSTGQCVARPDEQQAAQLTDSLHAEG